MNNEAQNEKLISDNLQKAQITKENMTKGDSWSELQLYTNLSTSFPEIVSASNQKLQPCFLFRGKENWLSHFRECNNGDEKIRCIRQEVRALSARWLKMQNVCVLMGAGASKYITDFVGSGLYERVRKLLDNRNSCKTLDSLLKYASKPDEIGKRFEEFLSQLSALSCLLEVERWPIDKLRIDIPLEKNDDKSKLHENLREVTLDLERAIAVRCNVFLPSDDLFTNEKELTPHEYFLAKLVARDPQSGRARIFTTNYDTLIEQAMDRLGILYFDGFTGTVNRRFNPAAYDLDIHYPGEVTEGRVRRYDKVLHIYKLHGSINWRRSLIGVQNPYGILFDNRPLPTVSEIISDLNKNSSINNDLLSRVFGESQSLAIFPTAAKYGESLAMPYAHLFRSMGQTLLEPQTVLFILGYSGWDSHINQMVEDALTNPGFSCVIVDPNPSKWARTLCNADYCGRIYCFGGEWGKFEFFSNQILPDLEVLKTELSVSRTLRDLQRSRKESTESEVSP